MLQRRTIVVIGATSMMAVHCARTWLKDEALHLILIGRDLKKTERVADDLRVRSPGSHIEAFATDFFDVETIQALADSVCASNKIDVVLIAQGALSDQALCQTHPALIKESLDINGLSPVLFAEAFLLHMEQKNHGTLALIGSVAGDRGRKSNYVYGAAKAFLTCYTEGLQHRLYKKKVKVVLIKPGPTDTPMTAHLHQKNVALADVSKVAKEMVSGIEKGKKVIYTPRKWKWIMRVIRHLPGFIFNRMDI